MREMREIKVYKQKEDHGPSPPHHSYKKQIPPQHQPQPSTSPKFSQRNTTHLGITFSLLPHHHHYKKEVYFGMSLSLPPFSPSSLSKQRLNFLPYHFYLHKEEFFILSVLMEEYLYFDKWGDEFHRASLQLLNLCNYSIIIYKEVK